MKIIKETSDEFVIREGNLIPIICGIFLIVFFLTYFILFQDIPLWLLIVATFFGLVLIIFPESVLVSVTKHDNKVKIIKKSLFKQRSWIKSFSEIDRISLFFDYKTRRSGDKRELEKNFRFEIFLKANEEILIGIGGWSVNDLNAKTREQKITKISERLAEYTNAKLDLQTEEVEYLTPQNSLSVAKKVVEQISDTIGEMKNRDNI